MLTLRVDCAAVWIAGAEASEATPFFERLCPATTMEKCRENVCDQSLGPEHLVERAEGDVGDCGNGLALRAHRCRGSVRQDPRGGISREESERAGADARGRRRLYPLGIQF